MKKIISIILVLSFAFSSVALAEDWAAYSAQKKEPMLGALAEVFVPTLGHAYAGDWVGGLPFFAAEVGGLVLAASSVSVSDSSFSFNQGQYMAGLMITCIASIWSMVDAYGKCETYNNGLKTKYGLTMYNNSPVLAANLSF